MKTNLIDISWNLINIIHYLIKLLMIEQTFDEQMFDYKDKEEILERWNILNEDFENKE